MAETQKKLNTAEAAEYLGVRPNTLEVWRLAKGVLIGALPYFIASIALMT